MKTRLKLTILVICLLIVTGCSDGQFSSSVQDAKEYEDLTMSFDEEISIEDDDSSEEAQDPRDQMTEDEYLEYLSGTIPYLGMSEDYIDKTACGEHTDTGQFGTDFGYRWSFGDLHAMTVYVTDGKVTKVNKINEDVFWDGDIPHLEEQDGKMVWKPIPGALHKRWEEYEAWRDKDVDNFKTAEDYADYYHDDYIKLLLLEYSDEVEEYGEEFLLEQSYLDAIDHWERNQPLPEPKE